MMMTTMMKKRITSMRNKSMKRSRARTTIIMRIFFKAEIKNTLKKSKFFQQTFRKKSL